MIKKTFLTLLAMTVVSFSTLAQTPTASPSLEQRVSDLEAYVNNLARGADATNPQAGSNVSGPGPGHNAWLMTSALLVLFMTLPGLALFYGGLVRTKNVLSVLMQCFAIACLVSVLWVVYGYSLAFGPGGAAVGGLSKAFFAGIGEDALVQTIPETVFAMFQLTFAIITPALVVGAFAERMKFSAMLLFSAL